jgi:hypothetical protein
MQAMLSHALVSCSSLNCLSPKLLGTVIPSS